MAQEQFANNAASPLVLAISVGTTSLQVALASSFPTLPQFRIIVDGEIMLVTGVAGSTFTVTRGVEGTAAVQHAAGAIVTHILTAGALVAALANVGASTYGSGGDGACVFDGVNTFSFATKNGNTYTLNRDVYMADGSSVSAVATVDANSFKLFCNGTLTNAGVIHNDGNAATLGTAGLGTYNAGTLGIGTAGGAGHVGVGAGANGSTQSNTLGDASLAGGAGGAGGAQAGGNGGIYSPTAPDGGADWLLPILSGFIFRATSGGNQAQTAIIGGGAGGGGGGSDNAGVTGGGGGGGGGVLALHVFNLINNGVIRAAGGAGAAASGAGGNGGGGGGGGGGMILNLSRFRSGTGTMTAPGGAPGAGVGTGVAGTAGNAGHVNSLQN